MTEKFGIYFGAMGDPIKEQLEQAGYELPDVDAVQADVTAVSRLHVRGLLSDSVAHTIHQKLMRRIVRQMKPI